MKVGEKIALKRLQEEISGCRICCQKDIIKPLPHEPRPVLITSAAAKISICGQAPGTCVHASGIPFSDPSGVRLREWMGISEVEFYNRDKFAIVPMGFCFPGLDTKGGDLPPRRECAAAWRQSVMDAMPQLQLILAIGIHAQAWHLGKTRKKNLTQTVAAWREYVENSEKPIMLPLPHPSWRNNAWLKKNPWFDKELLPQLKNMIQSLL
ncbi:MAG: uracil-DNA glycosylase family protein [Rhizobiaceae bacterium]|nr:uracil-DNA glycosylase family protein [Rhizobiaceae bacterium]